MSGAVHEHGPLIERGITTNGLTVSWAECQRCGAAVGRRETRSPFLRRPEGNKRP